MALQFIFDGKVIFIPQRGQSKGVARRLVELEQGGASFFPGSEIGRIKGGSTGDSKTSRAMEEPPAKERVVPWFEGASSMAAWEAESEGAG